MIARPSVRARCSRPGASALRLLPAWFFACALACAWSGPARADFSVSYRAKSATLVLFNQPQSSPFKALSARIFIRGDLMRMEATDHWGRSHIWISDRRTQVTWRLLENKEYLTEQGGWTCKDVPTRVASVLAGGLAQAGIDSLSISAPKAAPWQGQNARVSQWAFRARVFGLPKAVWVYGSMYFPVQETSHFGASVAELYCGKRPAESEWKAAFSQFLGLPESDARALAQVAGLPIAMDLRSELGMGSATLVLEATDISTAPLEASLFKLPEGYRPVAP